MRSQPGRRGPRKPVRAAPRRVARLRIRGWKGQTGSGGLPSFGDALRSRYIVERELGHGGMATVYLALDVKHDRPVALKAMRSELASNSAGSASTARSTSLVGWITLASSPCWTRVKRRASRGSRCPSWLARAYVTGCAGKAPWR